MVEGGEGGMVGLNYTIFYSHHALPGRQAARCKNGG